MIIRFIKTINESEVKSKYLNLTDDAKVTYGDKFPSHKTKFIIIDGKSRITTSQQHGNNQIWGSLKNWYDLNNIISGDKITVIYDPNEENNGIKVLHLVPYKSEENDDELIASTDWVQENLHENKDVEQAAVKYVTDIYKGNGWEVTSVEDLKCGFDLVCSKENVIENIEVKGTNGKALKFILTANELKQAKINSNFYLCIVTSALSKTRLLHKYSSSEFFHKFEFEPMQYKVRSKV